MHIQKLHPKLNRGVVSGSLEIIIGTALLTNENIDFATYKDSILNSNPQVCFQKSKVNMDLLCSAVQLDLDLQFELSPVQP